MDTRENKKIIQTLNDDPEDALLRLAILKENPEYQKMIDECRDVLDLMDFIAPDDRRDSFVRRAREDFGIIHNPIFEPWITTEEVKAILDPCKRTEEIPKKIWWVVSRMFFTHGIVTISKFTSWDSLPGDGWSNEYLLPGEELKIDPHERVIRIDLRKPKSQLMQEFELFLLGKKTNVSRVRKNTWRNLEIYRLWRDKETFTAIAGKLGIESVEKVKQAFYGIFKQIHGRPYDKKTDRSEGREAPTGSEGLCPTCPDLGSCEGTCDALEEHLQKHTGYQREKFSDDVFPDSDPIPEEYRGRKKTPQGSDDMK
jgi:hypothetical protein